MILIRSLIAGLSLISIGMLASCSSGIALSKNSHKGADSDMPLPASPQIIAKSRGLSKDKHGMPTYTKHTDRTRYVRTTAYSHMEMEPGAPGRMNASGGILKYGSIRSAAADWSVYPLGTIFRVKGQPHTYVVDDYGSELVGTNTIDIFKPTLSMMRDWGTRKTEITVIQWGSYDRSLALLKGRTRFNHCRQMYDGCLRMRNGSFASRGIGKYDAL